MVGFPKGHPEIWSFLVGKPMVVGETHHFKETPIYTFSAPCKGDLLPLPLQSSQFWESGSVTLLCDTNSEFAPANWCLGDDPASFWEHLFSGPILVLVSVSFIDDHGNPQPLILGVKTHMVFGVQRNEHLQVPLEFCSAAEIGSGR